MRKQGLQKRSEYYPISSAPGRMLQNGDTLIVSTDCYAGTIQVRAEGAHPVNMPWYCLMVPLCVRF